MSGAAGGNSPARDTRDARGLEVIGASAGSGKTYALTQTVCARVDPSGSAHIAPEALLGVTFTTRAADELGSRIRRSLVKSGALAEAQSLPAAYLGTVHSVCLRLVQEFALDAGLPPDVEVLADTKNLHLRRVMERSLRYELRQEMGALAERLRVHYEHRTERSNWLHHAYEVIDLARGNRIGPEALRAMGRRSAEGLLRLLPIVLPDGQALERELDQELEAALRGLIGAVAEGDDTDLTAKAIRSLQNAQRDHANGRLNWADWVTVATIKPAKKSEQHVEELKRVAAKYEAHPGFQSDLRAFTEGVFDAAAQALDEYASWKRRRHLVDYQDMVERALDLVQVPEVAAELGEKLRLVVVDEFQDTSPIQLSLFVALHQIVGQSVWVGDRKQCIFEFAGADPRLMDQVLLWSKQHGGSARQLETNYRSRPDLVRFCSELFSRALRQYGYEEAEVRVEPHRSERPHQRKLPALGLWSITASNKGHDATGIALGVERLLEKPEATPVFDPHTEEVRDVRPGDIAILVRSNDEARALAEALSARGVRSALARPGLLSTPEGVLLRSGLELLLDPTDRTARAVLEALHEFDGQNPDAWLEAHITERAEDGELPLPSWWPALMEFRDRMPVFSPSEAVLAVFDALRVTELAARWPEPEQRLANLDALRALATEYESACSGEGIAATVSGLLGYFDTAEEVSWDGEEMTARDDQAFTSDSNAVVIATYHRSKGLEWPVVVLGSLSSRPRDDAFGVHLESDEEQFDAGDPLGGRWIRYWPKPFGGKTNNVPLFSRAMTTEEARRTTQQELEQRARLLYVGMTRARDHLVFATRAGEKQDTTWLDELADEQGPLVTFGDKQVSVGSGKRRAPFAVRVWQLDGTVDDARVLEREEPRVFDFSNAVKRTAPSYWVSPSRVSEVWPELAGPELREFERIGEPLAVRRSGDLDSERFGVAVHSFFACDVEGLDEGTRRARAERLLGALGEPSPLDPVDVLLASERLREWVSRRYPGASWHREVPVTSVVDTREGARKIHGTIDLLLETGEGLVIVDHKSLPNPTDAGLREAAKGYAPQLGAYREALRVAHSKPVKECWVHFAVAGVVVGCVWTGVSM